MSAPAYLITDCGSTTTKAILVAREGAVDGVGPRPHLAGLERGHAAAAVAAPGCLGAGHYRLVARGEAPTTVEVPVADITLGVRAAVAALEARAGMRLWRRDGTGDGPDPTLAAYLSTSSAGGGLQMAVVGVVGRISMASAERAALAAGAIVGGCFSLDDGLLPHQRIAALRRLRPDIVLLAGGTDHGTVAHVREMAEWLAASGEAVPVVYAGNRFARDAVAAALGARGDLRYAANVRPSLDREAIAQARAQIHDLFMAHVMARAPGYARLLRWVAAPVLPTPSAVGLLIEAAARRIQQDVVAVDIGGATTDIFSVASGRFHRSVSANYGMSYSAVHVLDAAGVHAVARWLPLPVDAGDLTDRVANKLARPTTVPATGPDLLLEQALAREAMRLAMAHHQTLAVGLRGARVRPGAGTPEVSPRLGPAPGRGAGGEAGELGAAAPSGGPLRMDSLGLIIGSGGILSHAPRRAQAALMLIDALQPSGFCRLAVDSVFMLPHLGVLSTLDRDAAEDVLWQDCLLTLGTLIAPRQRRAGEAVRGGLCARLAGPGVARRVSVSAGGLMVVPLAAGQRAVVEVQPGRAADLGAGWGRPVRREVEGGAVGIIFDCRGRPLVWPAEPRRVAETARRWLEAAEALPGDVRRV